MTFYLSGKKCLDDYFYMFNDDLDFDYLNARIDKTCVMKIQDHNGEFGKYIDVLCEELKLNEHTEAEYNELMKHCNWIGEQCNIKRRYEEPKNYYYAIIPMIH